jgi:hypothetical protein
MRSVIASNYLVSISKPSTYTGQKDVVHISGNIKAVSKKTGKRSKYKDAILFNDEDLILMDNGILIPVFSDAHNTTVVRFIGGKTLENYIIVQCISSDLKYGIMSLIPTKSKFPRFSSIYLTDTNNSLIKVLYTFSSTPLLSMPNVSGLDNIETRRMSESLDDDDLLVISRQKSGLKNNLSGLDTVGCVCRSTIGLIYSTVNPELIFDILNVNKHICKKR